MSVLRTLVWLCCLAPLALPAWERESSAQFSLSHNYLRRDVAGVVGRSWVGQVNPRWSVGIRGAKTRVGMDYGLRGQLSVPSGGERVYHQFGVDAERDMWRRRLRLSLSAGRSQSILAPERGLISDYFIGGGTLSDVDRYAASIQWISRLGRWARLGLEGGLSESRYGEVASQRRNWNARLSQGSRFRRISWGVSVGEAAYSSGQRGRILQRQGSVDGALLWSYHWSTFAQFQRVEFDRASTLPGVGSSAGGGNVYLAGLRYRANRRASAEVGYQRGFFGEGVTGRADYRHRRIQFQLSAGRNLINGLATLGGVGGSLGGTGLNGLGPGAQSGVAGGAGLPGSGSTLGVPGVGAVATQNVVYVSRTEQASVNYQGRRLGQTFSWRRVRYESQADQRVTRYEDWSMAPSWRFGGRTSLEGRIGGRRYMASGVAPIRLAFLGMGARHNVGARSQLSLNASYYRQVGGVRRTDLRVSLQFQHRLWP